jgi:hypothetical protein
MSKATDTQSEVSLRISFIVSSLKWLAKVDLQFNVQNIDGGSFFQTIN